MPKILRTKCKISADGKHIRDDIPSKKKKNGNWLYGSRPKCGACGKWLGRWRRV